MNWRYVVLLVFVFVPFIMMGKNPFEAPEGYVPPDEFQDGIRAKIEQPAGGFAGGFTGQNNGLTGGSALMGLPGPDASQSYNSGMGNASGGNAMLPSAPLISRMQNPATNPYANQNTNEFQGQGQGSITVPPPAQVVDGSNAPQNNFAPEPLQQQQQFYQPVPFQNLPNPGSKLQLPEGYPYFQDKAGKTVAFVGATVYTTDKDGIAKLMPDGKYTLNNGHELIVIDGKKWWPRNANKFN